MNSDFNDIIDSANANEQFKMPQLNPQDYETITCDMCGNAAFYPAMIIKKVPGVMFGSANKYQLVPDQILVCAKCGTILKKDRQYYNLSNEGIPQQEKKEEKQSSIIV